MSMLADDPLESAARWQSQDRKVAFATVAKTWGSAPRPPGSQLAVREDGAFAGSVSGGCVEGVVIEQAQEAIADGKMRRLEFGVSDQQAWSVGLACGGRIEILVEPAIERETITALLHARREGKPLVRAVDLATGGDRLLEPETDGSPLGTAAAAAARADQSRIIELDDKSWFLTVYNPPLELVIVGAVHIAQPLAKMAALAGYRVRVIDPRSSFATKERFPDVELMPHWPDEALAGRPLGRRSALVALTHDPKIDDPALTAALASPAFYVGALGSKKTHTTRLDRLAAQGVAAEALVRIHGPVGLAIGSKTPQEIAISILADMTKVLRQPQL
jgi:xanthine dehydrogenase accessory factor